MKRYSVVLTAALAAALAATPLFASGEGEGTGDGSGGAMMALEAVGGTPYVDYYWPKFTGWKVIS